MAGALDEDDWDTLVGRIAKGYCTPFLGAGASTVGLGSAIAHEWSKEYGFTKDTDDLAKVAQALAVRRRDQMFPKDKMIERVEKAGPPDPENANEPHQVLAELPLSVYLTTNYDDFLVRALETRTPSKNPRRHVCRWNSVLKGRQDAPAVSREFEPTADDPLVFHLHGHAGVRQSLVLTEDDYLDFLVAATRDLDELLPYQVTQALKSHSLIFIGYRLSDWSFRVIFRGVIGSLEDSLESRHVAVQLPEGDEAERKYLDKVFARQNISVYWGRADEFACELRTRWQDRYG